MTLNQEHEFVSRDFRNDQMIFSRNFNIKSVIFDQNWIIFIENSCLCAKKCYFCLKIIIKNCVFDVKIEHSKQKSVIFDQK